MKIHGIRGKNSLVLGLAFLGSCLTCFRAAAVGEIFTFPIQNPPTHKYWSLPHDGPFGNKVKLTVEEGSVLAKTANQLIMSRRKAKFTIEAQCLPFWSSSRNKMNVSKDFRIDDPDNDLNIAWISFSPYDHLLETFGNKTEWIAAYVATADLAVDSQNLKPFGGVEYSDETDANEKPSPGGNLLGKVILCNQTPNSDSSTKPGWADLTGSNEKAGAGQFATMHLHLHGFKPDTQVRFTYEANDPAQIPSGADANGNWVVPGGAMRVWTVNVDGTRNAAAVPNGHYIASGTVYSLDDLKRAKVADGHFVFYVEGVRGSSQTADKTVKVEVQSPNDSWATVDTVSFTLLFMELKDLKGPGESDDVTVAFRSGDNDKSEANIAWIESSKSQSEKTPRMPQLQVKLKPQPTGLKVKWRLENRYPRRNGRDDLDFPKDNQVSPKPASQPWNIYSEYSSPEKFFGGDCTIFATILDSNEIPLSTEQKFKFRIRGKNPDDSDCKTKIVATQGNVWYAWAIAKHESADSIGFYNQFANGLANGNAGAHGAKGEPFYSQTEGDGWGLFQRDSASQHPVTSEETWSWIGNTNGFLNDEYPEHLRIASNYIDSIKRNNPLTFEEPQFKIKGLDISGKDILALTWYNGPQGRSNSRMLHFDGNRPSGQRWSLDLPNAPEKNQSYVAEIMDQYNSR